MGSISYRISGWRNMYYDSSDKELEKKILKALAGEKGPYEIEQIPGVDGDYDEDSYFDETDIHKESITVENDDTGLYVDNSVEEITKLRKSLYKDFCNDFNGEEPSDELYGLFIKKIKEDGAD